MPGIGIDEFAYDFTLVVNLIARPINATEADPETPHSTGIEPMRGISANHAGLMCSEAENCRVTKPLCPDRVMMQCVIFTDNTLETNDVPQHQWSGIHQLRPFTLGKVFPRHACNVGKDVHRVDARIVRLVRRQSHCPASFGGGAPCCNRDGALLDYQLTRRIPVFCEHGQKSQVATAPARLGSYVFQNRPAVELVTAAWWLPMKDESLFSVEWH